MILSDYQAQLFGVAKVLVRRLDHAAPLDVVAPWPVNDDFRNAVVFE